MKRQPLGGVVRWRLSGSRMWARRWILLLALLTLLPSAASAQGNSPNQPPEQEITLTLDGLGLHAAGITPGGEVAWFGAWRYHASFITEVGTLDERSRDDDDDGEVSTEWPWQAGRQLPYAGLFFVVDLETGDYGLAAPPGFLPREMSLERLGLARDGGFLEIRSEALALLTVRPGKDAWFARPKDGGVSDEGRGATDGRIHLAPGRLRSKGKGTPPPQAFKHKDRFFGIDTNSMEFFVLIVPGPGK